MGSIVFRRRPSIRAISRSCWSLRSHALWGSRLSRLRGRLGGGWIISVRHWGKRACPIDAGRRDFGAHQIIVAKGNAIVDRRHFCYRN
jgi:hypothetical protein